MKVNFRLIKSGKYEYDYGQGKPTFGYNWFFFYPRLCWNGGYWKHAVTDLSISFLFYNFGIVIWWK